MTVGELLEMLDWQNDRNKPVIAIECGKIEEADRALAITGVNIIDGQVIFRTREIEVKE